MKSVNVSTFTFKDEDEKEDSKLSKPTCDICCDDGGIDEGMEWSKLPLVLCAAPRYTSA